MCVCQNGNYHGFLTNTLSPFGVEGRNEHTALVSSISGSFNSLPGPSKRSVFFCPTCQEINMYSAVTDITMFALDFLYFFSPTAQLEIQYILFTPLMKQPNSLILLEKGSHISS